MTLKYQGFLQGGSGIRDWLGFGEETLASLPTLRSLRFMSTSHLQRGWLYRSGALRYSQPLGQAGGGQTRCGDETLMIRNKGFPGQSKKTGKEGQEIRSRKMRHRAVKQ